MSAERALAMVQLVEAQPVAMGVGLCTSLIDGLDDKQQRLHLLVSLLLSSQTKDQVTANAMARLRTQGFTLEKLEALSESELQELIYPVGFYRRKAVYLKKVFQILASQYDGDIPQEIPDMLALPGIGPKMAYLLQSSAWGKNTGIGVDTHVHRLAELWEWVPATKDPEKVRKQLQEIFPQSMWFDLNSLLVRFGQSVCVPRAPRCGECLLNSMCRGSKVRPQTMIEYDPEDNRSRTPQLKDELLEESIKDEPIKEEDAEVRRKRKAPRFRVSKPLGLGVANAKTIESPKNNRKRSKHTT